MLWLGRDHDEAERRRRDAFVVMAALGAPGRERIGYLINGTLVTIGGGGGRPAEITAQGGAGGRGGGYVASTIVYDDAERLQREWNAAAERFDAAIMPEPEPQRHWPRLLLLWLIASACVIVPAVIIAAALRLL
ncbi:hypothetical protein BST13_33655 [Mycobacterium aquaticum]|uniref:Uncharacterized protein n=2 Tax=Mycobacterium aquaticum TaxID=1927124 RepID=A0A1X0A4X4_9MYCO|nr:hypothetical protein BST13_33655 [Mycobacterium aquaticum]